MRGRSRRELYLGHSHFALFVPFPSLLGFLVGRSGLGTEVSGIVLPELDDHEPIFKAQLRASWLQNELAFIAYKEKFRHVAIIATIDTKNYA